MNADRVREIFDKIPVLALALVAFAWLGYGYYDFQTSTDSPLGMKRHEIEAAKAEYAGLQSKAKQLQEFIKELDNKRTSLRQQALKLEEMKGTLSDTFDVPGFMQLIVTEAKRVGLTVNGIKPLHEEKKEFYSEQTFDFSFRGVYVQLIVLLARMSQMQNIVRVDTFTVKPVSSQSGQYVALEGTLEIKGYSYLRSKADELAKNAQQPEKSTPAPATAAETSKNPAGGMMTPGQAQRKSAAEVNKAIGE